jgi:putative cardiolipin synthase
MSEPLTRPAPGIMPGPPRPQGTRLERAVNAALRSLGARAPETGLQSGIALVPDAARAFAIRAATARAADRTLDLQYYIWRGDVTGRLMAAEVLRAADRGVAVRMLLDDVYALGRERVLASLDSHRNIEIRLFNSISWRRLGTAGYLFEMAFGGWHLNRRMHNKAWIADGRLAIVGGRNIGDEYYSIDTEGSDLGISFRDLDLVIAGPAARQATEVFERYWNSPLARPARQVNAAVDARGGLPALRRDFAEAARRPGAAELLAPLAGPAGRHIRRGLILVGDGTVQVRADPPEKAKRGLGARRRARRAGGIHGEIADVLREAKREALLISPYFVPGRAGMDLLLGLRARGVHVSVVTNSLAATDVVAVHGGYAKYRIPLLRAGVELFELKPQPSGEDASLLGSRGAALHTKAFVVDGMRCFVGSFNLDPRSAALNTEMGAFVSHPVLARQVAAEHARLSDPARSWRLVLEEGRLAWCDRHEDAPRSLHAEPVASFWRRAIAAIVRRLPVEEQL